MSSNMQMRLGSGREIYLYPAPTRGPLSQVVVQALHATGRLRSAAEVAPFTWRASDEGLLRRLVVSAHAMPVENAYDIQVMATHETTPAGTVFAFVCFVSIVGWFLLIFAMMGRSTREQRELDEVAHGVRALLAQQLGAPRLGDYRLAAQPS
ncbi:MAG: hypothetical protein HY908_20300 [Myxococcales bacterium]|nr:hypothetical protein [Myxococcales bacterium]